MSRYRRGIRQASMKAVLGISAAALVGGAAIGAVAMAATSSSAPTAAASAAYGWSYQNPSHQQVEVTSAVSSWKKSQQKQHTSLAAALAQLAGTKNFSTVRVRGTTLAAQVGVELTVTNNHYLVVQSADGTVNVWVLSGATRFQNVTSSTNGTRAWQGAKALAKGDTIFVEGAEHHGDLDAQLVMFSTTTTTTPTTAPASTMPTTTTSPTATGTATTPPATPTSTMPTTTTKPTSTTSVSAPPTFPGHNS